MKIANRTISTAHSPYIVAEISGNHGGSISNAIRLIKVAKKAGAHAIKTQCYEPDTITLNVKKPDFIVQSGLWVGKSLYDLYKKAHTPFAWHKELYKVAHEEGITIFSSVFDYSSVDLLQSLGCPCYKIASFEVNDLPLIEYATGTGKPLIISTGTATDEEILEANEASKGSAAFLHCTSEYPGTIEHASLIRMTHIAGLLNFKNPIGVSDHTVSSNVVPIAATAMNAEIIEKHLKLDDVKTEDSEFSLNPTDFKWMAEIVGTTFEALKDRPQAGLKQLRRSLYAVGTINKGDIFTKENIRSIRPGYGLPPKLLPKLIGKKATKNYRIGDPLS